MTSDMAKLADEQVHDVIYLQPWCDGCQKDAWGSDGRQWCEDDPWGQCEECDRKAVKYTRTPPASESPVRIDQTLTWGEVLNAARVGMATWAAKDHNRKWWKRIDGTPIPNDLCVNFADAIIAYLASGKDAGR